MADPRKVLRLARIALRIMWVNCLLSAVLVIGIGLYAFIYDWPEGAIKAGERFHMSAEMVRHRVPVALFAIVGWLLAGTALLQELLRIIDSTTSGDPFVPENARRLRKVGWLLLIMTLIFEPAGTIFAELDWLSIFDGLVMVLLVFVLAQVFEKGSNMRTELQETV